jgi:D-alanyl-D-alanine carboxypeptidase/D-alanyl-D-alanine-endopeptidase (penicillin-binding protein 4)
MLRLRACATSLAAVVALTGCAARTPPATAAHPPPRPAPAAAASEHPAPGAPPQDAVDALRGDLASLFLAPKFDRMQWGVCVQSLESGEILFGHQASKLMMPASNMKILTLAAAAERLGWGFTYETTLVSSAPVTGGTLRGDLIVVGSGDPTINGHQGPATHVFEEWADQLRAAGIQRIDGRVVADARAFDGEPLGAGWAWDYLGYGYAAGASALEFNEDAAEVDVRPGPSPGAPAVVEVRPVESGLLVDNRVTTTPGGDPDIVLRRSPGSSRLFVGGTIPAGSPGVARAATVDRPALYFARMLRSTLMARGIAVSGDAGEYEPASAGASPRAASPVRPSAGPAASDRRVLASHRSPPLSEIARVLMKVSQNLYAETLLRTLGAQTGSGTAAAGQRVVREVLSGWGVPPDAYVLSDGSGLSRYNLVCAESVVKVLRQLYRDPRHREAFLATLPVGGQDGTLSRRFLGTRAEGNVRAKTGSIANVRTLSGYVTTLDGEVLAFSILANNFGLSPAVVDGATDQAVERLASFTRR